MAADAVLKAAEAKDPAALKALAEKDAPDPWLVADLLCYRGAHDAAEAFAKAAPRVDTEKLPAYVQAWRKREPDKAERELLVAMNAANQARQPAKIIEGTASLDPTLDTVIQIRLWSSRGMALWILRRREEGEAALSSAADAALALGWLARASSLYGQSATCALYGSAFPRALLSSEQLLALAKQRGDKRGAAWAIKMIGHTCQRLGDYARALSSFEQEREHMTAVGDKAGAAGALVNIGIAHIRLGNLAKALSTSEQGLSQLEALGDKAGVAGTLVNIGQIYVSLGDYAKALSANERGFDLAEKIGHRQWAVNALGNSGVIYKALGDFAKALSSFEQARAHMAALGDKAGMASMALNIGTVYRERGEYAKALSTYEQALAQQQALGMKVQAAMALGGIGTIYVELGDLAKALSTYEQALAQTQALGDKAGAVSLLRLIGSVHLSLGDYAKARGFFDKSRRAATSIRATPLVVHAWTSLARLHLQQGEPSRALAAAQTALREVEGLLGGLGEEQGATAREQHASLFAIGALAATREEDAAEALTFLESGRAGALLDALDKREALRWKAESLPPELRRLDLEAQAKQSAARHAYDLAVKRGNRKETRAARQALNDAIEAVRDVAGRIQRDLKQQAGLFYPRAKTIEEIESALQEDQALVLYGLCLDEALALVLRHDGERVVSLGKASEIADACEALDATSTGSDPTAALETLRKLLVEPLTLEAEVKQVLLSPEGPLCYVPFGAIFDQTIAMTPSGTTHVLLLGEERAKGEGILALGDPDYGGASKAAQAIYYRGRSLSPLPATRTEVETIGTQTLLGASASEAGFREALPTSKRWRAVHFACHGLVNIDKPMLSLLALSREGDDDGFLTALEILRTKIPADLAVLSACETGKGKIVKGEGIVGLTRAFMFAGAPRVICSLWKVDDEATKALMVKFYELWNPKEGTGLGAAAALQKAQAYVRDFKDNDGKQRWKHPYYWAAWVLWGLPN